MFLEFQYLRKQSDSRFMLWVQKMTVENENSKIESYSLIKLGDLKFALE